MTLEDYLGLRMPMMPETERASYAGTQLAYEFHSTFNNPKAIVIFRDKVKFLQAFAAFARRSWIDLADCSEEELVEWLRRQRRRVILKPRYGVGGRGIRAMRPKELLAGQAILRGLRRQGAGLLEEEVVQHADMAALCPTSVNTIRVITLRPDEDILLLGAVLRIGTGMLVDNLSSGGMAAPVDTITGLVRDGAMRRDVRCLEPVTEHPLTMARIAGFRIPFWQELVTMVRQAAQRVPQVRTVGWDVAIGPEGPLLIEGNDNWNKRIWQLAERSGKREVLMRLMTDFQATHCQPPGGPEGEHQLTKSACRESQASTAKPNELTSIQNPSPFWRPMARVRP